MPPDDDELGALVRELADEWTMPPQRLGERSWQERTRGGGARGGAGRAPWARRAGRASMAVTGAVAATIVLALLAAWIALPRNENGTRPIATAPGSTVTATEPGTPPPGTPLPAIARFGPLPDPSQIVVGTGNGLAVLDLATGRLGPSVGGGTAWSPLIARPGGGYVAVATSAVTRGSEDGLTVRVEVYDAAGALRSEFAPSGVPELIGRTDPTVKGAAGDQGQSAAIDASLGPDGRTLYLGWIRRTPPSWQSGIDVIDLATRATVQTLRLPDMPSSTAGSATFPFAGHVLVSPDGGHAVIHASTADGRASWSSATVHGTRLASVTPFATGTGTLDACADGFTVEGFATASTYFAICGPSDEPVVFRRVDLQGRPLGDTALPGIAQGQFPGQVAAAVVRSSGTLYAWAALSGSLVRVDLASGRVSGRGSIPAPTASSGGPLAAIGSAIGGLRRWIAPPTAAKIYLQPALAVSPDGTRVYALGVNAISSGDPSAGSSGVWVFDASTLAVVAHWAPTADFTSIGVSADGRWVYAAGASGVDAAGRQGSYAASVTVFDAAAGSVRVIAGDLGDTFLDVAPGTSTAYP